MAGTIHPAMNLLHVARDAATVIMNIDAVKIGRDLLESVVGPA